MLKAVSIGALIPVLCGCVSTPSIEVSQTALPCWTLIKASGLLEATAGAPLPVNDTGGEIGAFGDRQTGQLDSANADKAGIKRMGDLCERLNAEALEKSRRRAKPWWKRVF